MKLSEMKFRGCDPQGCGHFGASRGSRKHVGVDMCCDPGTDVQSPVDGKVTKIGWPYDHVKHPDKTHLRYVENRLGATRTYNYSVIG